MRLRFRIMAALLCATSVSPLLAGDDPLTLFATHFGDDVTKARGTRDAADDVALAARIVEETPSISADPKVQALFFNRAFDLGITGPEGFEVCEKALKLLTEVAPDQKPMVDERQLQIFEKKLRGLSMTVDEREDVLVKYLAKLDEVASAKVADKKIEEATAVYTKAMPLFGTTNSPLPDRVNRIRQLQVASNKAATARTKVKANPEDPAAARDLVNLLMLDLDQPDEAAKVVAGCNDPVLASVVNLAAADPSSLDAAKLTKLGDWYRVAGEKSSGLGKANALSNSQRYFARVLEQPSATEAQKTYATTNVEQLARLNPPDDIKAVANETSTPQYIRVVAWDGGDSRRATAKAKDLSFEMNWNDHRLAKAAVGYEFSHVRKVGLSIEEMKFELDDDSGVAVVIDYHTKSGYSSRAALVIGGNPAKLGAPELHSLGLQREEIVWDERNGEHRGERRPPFNDRSGQGKPGKSGPGFTTYRESGPADTKAYECSEDIPSPVRRGVDFRSFGPPSTVLKIPQQTSFTWDIKTWAPKEWDGQAWVQLIAINPKNSNAKIRAKFDMIGYRPKNTR